MGYTLCRFLHLKGHCHDRLSPHAGHPGRHLAGHPAGALVGLARSTSSEPKTENTDAVLNAGLRLAAQPDAPAETLQRMLDITRAEKHAVAPNCATCAMPCGNTKDYDLTRLRSAAPAVRQRKLRLLQAVFRLAAQHPDADVQLAIYRGLFAFSEDWDEELLDPVIAQTEKLCRR